ncbi:MAG: GNAT family protein [Actinomycetota bacterium]|nr:GNAT family protein [Actinomycetota bacterium]MDK1104217.1 GNAT family protein [Actinomycetota bacterium]
MTTHIHSHPRYTKRLMIRPFRRRDVSDLHEAVAASLDDLQPWLPWAERYDRGVAQRFIRESVAAWSEGRAFDFTIRAIDDPGRHIGNVSVWPTSQQNHIGEIGYWIRSDETGRGFAGEATTLAMQVGFEELSLHKVQLRIAVGNVASDRIAERLGFAQEGILRDEVKVGGEWLDHTIWSLLEHEWWRHRDRHRAEGTIS